MLIKLITDIQRVIKYFEKKFHFLKEKVAIFEILVLPLQHTNKTYAKFSYTKH